ncbi:Cytochrome P450 monooxygenase [Boletus reticuloceps]|uniref:Cytochrome P450 monooxygenase n=1 Tax=Boletus reticuloceps TaxID=495285 RepID=A0A8I2YCD5_9AGAM|nr:Cytochrome P450 monooxygenase [Boletus reticuloceps]
MLIINSEKVAEDLLDKRSQNYSDRPKIPMVALMGWDFSVGLLPYGPSWRKHRKVMHQALSPTAMLDYRGTQLNKVHQLVKNTLQVPDNIEAHLRTFTASTIMAVIYGYEMAPQNDFFASIANRASEMLTNCFFPGAALVNAFPVLQHLPEWFPGTGFKHYAKICRKLTHELRELPFEFVQEQMAEGIAPHSMVSEMLEKNEEEDVIKSVAGTAYSSTVETSASTLLSFMLAMFVFPDVQKKAQAEIDRITSGNRMPDFGDRPSMIYLEATYREVLRWGRVAPLGLPHMTTGHDVYEGYFIPKDTFVLANIWSMTHNEDKYPEPMRFMPERFIDANGRLTDDRAEQLFGFGRRICVGKYFAEESVWIAMVSILAVFDLIKAKDEHGREIDVVTEYTKGVIIYPKPYPFCITPRSPRAAQLVQQTEVHDCE